MHSVQKRARMKRKSKYYKSHHKTWQHDNGIKLSQMVGETGTVAIAGDIKTLDVSVHLE